MKNLFRLVLLTALAALGFWLWTIFFPGPEKIIRQKITTLAQTATFSAKDSPIARALKAKKLAGLFSTDAELIADVPGYGARSLTGREEIGEYATAGFVRSQSLKVEFLDTAVRLGADKLTAEVSCTAKVWFGASKDFGVQEMRFQFKKINGTWLIARAETVKTLS